MNNFPGNNCCNPNPCCDPCSFPVNRNNNFAFVLVLFILLAIVGAAWF